MIEKIVQGLYIPRIEKIEKEIGCKLIFRNIPSRYINGWMRWDMTRTWKKFGLNIERGANYFTMGKVVGDTSSRFNANSPEYQSWLGGYTVKLAPQKSWGIDDHFALAIADQNNWLNLYGDPKPMTTTDGWKFTNVGTIQTGKYSGILYEGGCTTHSDVGIGFNSIKLRLACAGMAALFNFSNPKLNLQSAPLQPKESSNSHEMLKLCGYIAIFNIGQNTKIVLYGNGTMETFPILKNDLLNAMKSCEIVEM